MTVMPSHLSGTGYCPFNVRSADVEVMEEPNKALIHSRVSEGQHKRECVVLYLGLWDVKERITIL